MPIYEQTYRPWEGALEPNPRTWWVIARTGIQLLMRKGMVVFLFFAYIPFFIRAGIVFIIVRYGDKLEIIQKFKGLKIDADFYFNSLSDFWARVFVIFICIFVGAGLIANDKQFKALSLYFSKPVGFWDYIIGKFLVIGFFVSLITLVPGLLLFLMRVLMAMDSVYLQNYFWIPLSLVGYVIVELLVLGGLILVVSAIFKSTRFAAVFFLCLIVFPELIQTILSKIPIIGLTSFLVNIKQFGAVFFGIERPYGFAPLWAFMVMAAIVALCIFLLKRHVKPTEVIR